MLTSAWTRTRTSDGIGSALARLDITFAGLDPRTCTNVALSGSVTVTGTWTAASNGTYTDGTTTMGTAHVALPPGCLMLSGTTSTRDDGDRATSTSRWSALQSPVAAGTVAAVRFLLSEEARYVNGANIQLSGAWGV